MLQAESVATYGSMFCNEIQMYELYEASGIVTVNCYKYFHTVFYIAVGPVAQSLYRLSYGLDGPGSNPGGD